MDNKGRLLRSGFLANIGEWYDYTIFAFLAPTLSAIFFPHLAASHSLLLTFFIFALAYFARPIGGLVLGKIADSTSIATAYKCSLILMAIPAVIIALLPVGHMSSVVIVTAFIGLRLLQGLAVGGEFPLLALYLYKGSNKNVFYSSLGVVSAVTGVFLASCVAAILHAVLTPHLMQTVGWRIGFGLAAILAVMVFVVQRSNMLVLKKPNATMKTSGFAYVSTGVIMLLTTGAGSFVFYTGFVWLPHYLKTAYHISSTLAFTLGAVNLLVMVVTTLCVAYRATPNQTTRYFRIGLVATTVLFVVGVALRDYGLFIMVVMGIGMAVAFAYFQGTIYYIICTQASQLKQAAMLLAFTFSVSQALFGSAAPAICTYLVNHYSIKGVLLLAVLLTVIALLASCCGGVDNRAAEVV